ncbi:MAG TPA: MXAN_5187 C-terminal domain-containing protein [Vicinamibacterales bacterium]
MAELSEVQRDLQTLAAELKRLEAEYNGFFAGRSPRPPWETRGRVEAIIKRWDRGLIETSVDRFRFQTLQARFAAFVDLWDRGQRAREEGRPGPFAAPPPKAAPRRKDAEPEAKVLHVTAFRDPMREMDKLHSLYDSLMDARREAGDDVVPFHRFAALVKDQVGKLRDSGSPEVAFRVAVKDGKVNLTVRGLKGIHE